MVFHKKWNTLLLFTLNLFIAAKLLPSTIAGIGFLIRNFIHEL